MSKQIAVLKIKREADGFSGVLDGSRVSFDKISKIVEALRDELETLGQSQNTSMTERRLAIWQNDKKKNTPEYKGSATLAKEWGVSVGTIVYDKKQNELHPPSEPVTEVQEPVKSEITEEPVIEPSPEPEAESEKKSKKNGKGKKGKH